MGTHHPGSSSCSWMTGGQKGCKKEKKSSPIKGNSGGGNDDKPRGLRVVYPCSHVVRWCHTILTVGIVFWLEFSVDCHDSGNPTLPGTPARCAMRHPLFCARRQNGRAKHGCNTHLHPTKEGPQNRLFEPKLVCSLRNNDSYWKSQALGPSQKKLAQAAKLWQGFVLI